MWLTDAQAQAIVHHARADFPREACGVIAGHAGRALEIIPIPNAAADPLRTYVMEPRATAAVLTGLDGRGLELVGFYHSHPQGDPIPSQTDKALATYPDTPYLIVGLRGGQARLAAWLMRPGQVDEVPVHVGEQPPQEPVQRLSQAQRAAILLSAIIAFLLLIVVSLALLPPAPIIPH